MWTHLIFGLLCTLACAVNAQTAASAALATTTSPTSRSTAQDHVVAGGTVRIQEPVTGDLIAAAGTLDVDAAVAGDALLFGGTVRLGAGVGRSVYAGAGRVNVHGLVGHNLRVAGGQVELLREASVVGNVSVAGGQVTLRGGVQGDVRVAGGTVVIDGPVQGPVWVSAGEVRLGPNAKLMGALHWRSKQELQRDAAAQVLGGEDRMAWPGVTPGMHPEHGNTMPMGGDANRWRSHGFLTGGWTWTLGLMLLAAVLVALRPATAQRVAATLRTRWPMSLLLGLVVIACVPLAALLLLITLIGAPLALVLMLLFPPLLIVGYVSFAAALGQGALARWLPERATQTTWQVTTAMVAVLLLAVLVSVPLLGPALAMLAVLSGMGLLLLQWQRLERSF